MGTFDESTAHCQLPFVQNPEIPLWFRAATKKNAVWFAACQIITPLASPWLKVWRKLFDLCREKRDCEMHWPRIRSLNLSSSHPPTFPPPTNTHNRSEHPS